MTSQEPAPLRVPAKEIEAAKTPNGGWTKAQLAEWGVEWPPRKGWRARLARHDKPHLEATTCGHGPGATQIDENEETQ